MRFFCSYSTNINIAVSFTTLILCLIPPTDDRETTERTPTQLPAYKKCFFLRWVPIKLFPFLKKSPQNAIFLAYL